MTLQERECTRDRRRHRGTASSSSSVRLIASVARNRTPETSSACRRSTLPPNSSRHSRRMLLHVNLLHYAWIADPVSGYAENLWSFCRATFAAAALRAFLLLGDAEVGPFAFVAGLLYLLAADKEEQYRDRRRDNAGQQQVEESGRAFNG